MERAGEEARALWTEVFGTPPNGREDPGVLLQRLVEQLPPVDYNRFTTPALNDGNIVWPTRAPAGLASDRSRSAL